MSGSGSSLWTHTNDHEYTEPRPVPRRVHRSHKTLRILFFVMAAGWGFLMGLGTLAIVLATSGASSGPSNPAFLWLLVPGAIVAALGGITAASAYREARRRHSR